MSIQRIWNDKTKQWESVDLSYALGKTYIDKSNITLSSTLKAADKADKFEKTHRARGENDVADCYRDQAYALREHSKTLGGNDE